MLSKPTGKGTDVQAGETEQDDGVRKPSSRRVLVVEDDEMLRRFLDRLLRREGFDVEFAHDGVAALGRMCPELDLLLLDLSLPGLDGLSVLRHLRPQYPKLPVLVLTGRHAAGTAVLALESGADDCLLKPFSYLELLARMRALLRRSTGASASQSQSQCGDLVLNRDELRVTRADRKIELTPREYKLLEHLMRTPKIPVSRATLLQEVWGAGCEPSTNIVDVYMKYVRDKIDTPGCAKLIRTVRGLGYVVSED